VNGTKDDVRTLFSGRAAEWAGWYADDEPRTLEAENLLSRQRLAIELLARAVPAPARVLDVGCATGELARRLTAYGYDVWGVDVAEPMIARARERFGADRFEVGDGERLPYGPDRFDAVVCLGVIEYQRRDEDMLAEIRRVLRAGGCAVLSTPNAVSPLHLLDVAALAAETAARPLYYFVKYRARGRRVPAGDAPAPGVRIRRYRRGPWLRRLEAAGLEPRAFVCRGWGWYRSRLGRAASVAARAGRQVGRALAGALGDERVRRARASFIRHPALNWLGAEQLVVVRKPH
jgi:SAM-dependent methyltransferase